MSCSPVDGRGVLNAAAAIRIFRKYTTSPLWLSACVCVCTATLPLVIGIVSGRSASRTHHITSHYIYINIFRLNLIRSFGFFFLLLLVCSPNTLDRINGRAENKNSKQYASVHGRTLNIPYSFFYLQASARARARTQTHVAISQRCGDACTTWKHVVFESDLMFHIYRRRRSRIRWAGGGAHARARRRAENSVLCSKRTISIVHTTRFRWQRFEKPHTFG